MLLMWLDLTGLAISDYNKRLFLLPFSGVYCTVPIYRSLFPSLSLVLTILYTLQMCLYD
jgi:hypothetical protein